MSINQKTSCLASLVLTFAGLSFGQTLTCNTTQTSPVYSIELRAEGASELVSDTVITCSGATSPLQGTVTAVITGTGVQSITGKILAGGVSEATLQVIDNSGGSRATVYYPGTISGLQATFGSSAEPVTFPTYAFILQISNVRVNVAGSYGQPTAVYESVSVATQAIALLPVGLIRNGVTVNGVASPSYTSPGSSGPGTAGTAPGGTISFPVCHGQSGTPSFSVTVGELFAGAFKTQWPASVAPYFSYLIPGAESGSLIASAANGLPAGVGTAVSGTRIKFVFNNIPANVSLSVPTVISVGPNLQLNLTESETGAFAQIAATTGAGTDASTSQNVYGANAYLTAGSTVTAFYEVTQADLTVIKYFTLPVNVTYAANTVTAQTNPITVTASYAPSPATRNDALPAVLPTVPYFANTGTPLNGAYFTACPATTTVLTSPGNPALFGKAISLTARVSPSTVTGTVAFKDGATVLGTATLSGGTAQLSISAPTLGTHLLTASYSGDANNDLPSVSAVLSEVVDNPTTATSITLQSSLSPSKFGQSVTLTATLSPTAATGKITFYDGAIVLGTATVSSGAATLTTKLLPAGAHSLRARLAYGDTYLASTSASLAQVVGTVPVASGGFRTGATYPAGTAQSFGIPGANLNVDAVIVGDFNGDNIADLAVSNGHAGIISIFLGVGDGTFASKVDYPAGTYTLMLVSGDFNGDGKTDIAAQADLGVNVLLGNGDGTFGAFVNYPVPVPIRWIATGDFNEDGQTDLVVATDGDPAAGSGAGVLLGNGNGTFQPVGMTYVSGTSCLGVAVSDFDNDGKSDLALIGSAAIYVLTGNGDGSFQAVNTYASAPGLTSVVAGDFNGDGKADLATANGDSVNVLLGNGGGSFQPGVSYSVSGSPLNVVSGDFNGDGNPDLLTTSFRGASLTNMNVLIGNGDGSFRPATSYSVGNSPSYAATGDFNGDGAIDVAFTTVDQPSAGQFVWLLTAVTGTLPQSIGFGPLGNVAVGKLPFSVSATSDSGLAVTFTSGTPSVCAVSGNTVSILAAGGCSVIASQAGNATYAPFSVTRSFTAGFIDLVGTYYDAAITAMAQRGITAGCGSNDYCAQNPVTRDQMAIFMVRAVYGSDNFSYSSTPYFTDVTPTTFGFKWIQKLKELGITGGCGVGLYCPTQIVTRDQMAIFIERIRLGVSVAGSSSNFTWQPSPLFPDITGNFAFPWIQRLASDGITGGCGAGLYCPGNPVIRGDMAIFIMRGAFNQFLPASTPLIISISPSTLALGTTGSYTISGTNTSFAQGTTQLSPIPGVTIGTIAVNSATSLTVQLTASANAVTQPYSLIAITGSEQAVLPNGLVIQ